MDEVVRTIPVDEKICIGGDFNGHIGKEIEGYPSIHGGQGFGTRNEGGINLLDFAMAHDLGIVNSIFKKRDSHLITFSSGGHDTQIDYLLMRRGDRSRWLDCKVLPGDAVVSQHRLLVTDIAIRKKLVEEKKHEPMIICGCLKGEKIAEFRDKVIAGKDSRMYEDTNSMWEAMSDNVTRVAQETLGMTTRRISGQKE
ncbi:hypothetical protein E3N88_24281 [Mikania micrantha]|uniref:Endonuclease/exonuclease/phosphatase domain-containing protein n=1 Tax=Mikania micrantha TaxID=192012 RepID=A0A5N6NHA7_9ASTR|nr:hypothetical protein E3N88_24281 [Mikania micrantha]